MAQKQLSQSKIEILGDNILLEEKQLTAFYILPLANYSVVSTAGIENNINRLTHILSELAIQKPNVKFSIQRCVKSIRAEDIKANLLDTIKLYNPTYSMPYEFTSKLKDASQTYCLLAVKLDPSDVVNVEDVSFLDTVKSEVGKLSSAIFDTSSDDYDLEKVLALEKSIFAILSDKCVRASKDLVFYSYVSRLYPMYDISYDKLSFFNNSTYSSVLGSVTQTVEDKFGYFIMHNEGIDEFDIEPVDTYGCIVNIFEFPKVFDISRGLISSYKEFYDNMQINIETLSREQATSTIVRRRGTVLAESQEAAKAGAQTDRFSELMDLKASADRAMSLLENREVFCKFNVSFLVTGTSLEKLRQNITLLITDLKYNNIVATKSLTQARDFLQGFVKLQPTTLNQFGQLLFPLSLQINVGSVVGESQDSKFAAPAIGEDI